MRIDFGASFKDVSRLLNASSEPTPKGSGALFEEDLKAVLTKPQETLADVTESPQAAALMPNPTNPLDEMKASLRWQPMEMTEQVMTPAEPPQSQEIQDEVPLESVKTPTLLEAKRIKIDREEAIAQPIPQLSNDEIRAKLRSISEKVGLDPTLAMSVVKAESSFNTRAVSSDGHASKGLFQLLDTTGKTLLARSEDTDRSYDPFDPHLNMELGTSYLKYLHSIFSTPTDLPNNLKTHKAADEESLEKFAVAAFNAGEGRVASAQGRSERAGKDPSFYEQVAPFLPRSTREYVTRVLGGKKLF